MATTFPTSVQTFPVLYDVIASDGALVTQMQQYVQQGNMALAEQTLKQIPNYSSKFLTADLLNTAFETTIALENYYLQKWSPAYVVSSTQPVTQDTGDFWFQVM